MIIRFKNLCTLSAPPLCDSLTGIALSAEWAENGVTVVGGNGEGTKLDQLSQPHGLYVDEDNTIFVADTGNHRIVAWKCDAATGIVVAGGNGEGDQHDQLSHPTDVIVHKASDSLFICDRNNRRIIQWPRHNGTTGKILISGFDCYSLTMNNQEFLYVSSPAENLIRRFRLDESRITVVAGGNGKGDRLHQLNLPYCIFVDQADSLYVSDEQNHRVITWMKDETEGRLVAGGQGHGNNLKRLGAPRGVVVDQCGTIGSIIVGGNGAGEHSNQLNSPEGLSFDQQGNLYVVDRLNSRVQRFNIETGHEHEQPSPSSVTAQDKMLKLSDNSVTGE
jgi:sugar lactone lactonase YvrE